MSKYIEDVQGKIVSNPINETNTKYAFNEKNEDGKYHNDESPIDTQYMINNEPVSDIDSAYYDDYRNKVEELRKRTESTYESLEACLVPAEVKGMAFRPYVINTIEDDDGNIEEEKLLSNTYTFQDHLSPISKDSNEYVFKTNKVKFIDDMNRRLIYDKTIHITVSKEDEKEGLTLRDILYRTFFEFYSRDYYSLVKDVNGTTISIDNIINNIVKDCTKTTTKYYVVDLHGNEIQVKSGTDFSMTLKCGQDIDTKIPSTLYNLYNIGWVHASVIFLNGIIIPWTKIQFSVDKIDTYISIVKLSDTILDILDNAKDIVLDYIHIPFKVEYISGKIDINDKRIMDRYVDYSGINKDIAFIIDKYGGGIRLQSVSSANFKSIDIGSSIDRILCVDPDVKVDEFVLNNSGSQFDKDLKDVGIEYTKSFKKFCDNDYRCKLKRFNFIGFEINKYNSDPQFIRGTLKNDDFDITWHPFNIIDIRFKHLFNSQRVFKVFYNTKVLYDQDNILRIKNHDYLSDEYERYRKDITANIETYINEIYILAKKDIGTYVLPTGIKPSTRLKGYRYQYVTPYECYLLYNAINHYMLNKDNFVQFKDFKYVNVSKYIDPLSEEIIGYLNGGFIALPEDKEDIFLKMIKDTDIFIDDTDTEVREDIIELFSEAVKYANISEILVPIDKNTFYANGGDVRGMIVPHTELQNRMGLVKEFEDIAYDLLKFRFELSYLNNMEEGATPIDEFIYYFESTDNLTPNKYPITKDKDADNLIKRRTARDLNALANNIFKIDLQLVKETIMRLNFSACYILPSNTISNFNRDDYIVYLNTEVADNLSTYNFRLDPRFYYNFGFIDENDVKHKLSSEWGLRRNLPEMFYWSLDENEYTLNSMHLLDEVFDFTYDLTKTYHDNLKDGVNYIIGYDADKLEQSIKRSVISFTKTGKELKSHSKNSKLTMSRWNINSQDNYVMIFKNRELYNKYHTITYTDTTFTVDFDKVNTKDDDMFEFVFFLNADNNILKKVCKTSNDLKVTVPQTYYSNNTKDTATVTFDRAITCNTSIFEPENVQLLVNVMPTHPRDKYRSSNQDTIAYALETKVSSYESTAILENGERVFKNTISEDKKLNGLHRVTKQGGGEYILEFDGKIPERTDKSNNQDINLGVTLINPGVSNVAIGTMAFGTRALTTIEYNGTVEQWKKVSRITPWLKTAKNSVKCSDGDAVITSDETLDGTSTN